MVEKHLFMVMPMQQEPEFTVVKVHSSELVVLPNLLQLIFLKIHFFTLLKDVVLLLEQEILLVLNLYSSVVMLFLLQQLYLPDREHFQHSMVLQNLEQLVLKAPFYSNQVVVLQKALLKEIMMLLEAQQFQVKHLILRTLAVRPYSHMYQLAVKQLLDRHMLTLELVHSQHSMVLLKREQLILKPQDLSIYSLLLEITQEVLLESPNQKQRSLF